ncbi:hypothetical protein PUNSTDRAFT_135649 [Punctularia strigosozonata HHB-11173 SS5]|uniref:uncharacterized protein n=1 Tax=Punctularia strigosozonata (strain HHB-11173) TaxID=741275 RepID=UPI00044173B9|nr:uncharacterized protein PUNSTDRAFT_135649 [Punctularia strigosozonata HHB-11173 SS5]EIN06950.1 hypothetical protein PUNSTDRAFT_135649 [Punctularia strigosozonata HHB-11173 SS5]
METALSYDGNGAASIINFGPLELTLLRLRFIGAACVGRAVCVLVLVTVGPAAPDQTRRKGDLAGADVAIPCDRRQKGTDIYDKGPTGGSKHWSDKQKTRLFRCVIPRGFRHDQTNLNPRAGPSSVFDDSDEQDDDHGRPDMFGDDALAVSITATPCIIGIRKTSRSRAYHGDSDATPLTLVCERPHPSVNDVHDEHDNDHGRPDMALVIGIQTDGLFTIGEQREIAAHIPGAELVVIQSPDGHDGFLLEFEQINGHILRFLKREFPGLYASGAETEEQPEEGFGIKKTSVFGEAEADITRW